MATWISAFNVSRQYHSIIDLMSIMLEKLPLFWAKGSCWKSLTLGGRGIYGKVPRIKLNIVFAEG